ncbi:MAG TPA: hypothetical protein VF532_17005 [Candidatus Angelobacter sp.]
MRQIAKAAIPIAFFMPVLIAVAVQFVNDEPAIKTIAIRFLGDRFLGLLSGMEAFGVVFGPVLAMVGFLIFLTMAFRKKLALNAVVAIMVVLGMACIASVQACQIFNRIGK